MAPRKLGVLTIEGRVDWERFKSIPGRALEEALAFELVLQYTDKSGREGELRVPVNAAGKLFFRNTSTAVLKASMPHNKAVSYSLAFFEWDGKRATIKSDNGLWYEELR